MLDGDENFLKRFRNEARTAASLNHLHVATVYSVEDSDGHTFIAMEYIEGQTLDELIPEEGVDVETFVRWFVPVARALEHAHSRGVVHRDIKPGNIMITNDGIIKILDFGLANLGVTSTAGGESNHADLTQPGQVFGTPAYMSPEQAAGKEVDHRSDIFSLGVVMYEALTGSKPFRGDSNAEVVGNLMKTDPPSVIEVRPDAPPVLSQLIDRCLQKRAADRFPDMQHVKSMLREAQTRPMSDVSTGSFGRRLYRETTSTGWRWKLATAVAVVALAVASWSYFSREATPPIGFDRMTMKLLSESNNVGFAQISPDGKSIAFATFDEDGSRSLWFRRIDNRNALQLVPPE
jgi:serine/threonine protein kinase